MVNLIEQLAKDIFEFFSLSSTKHFVIELETNRSPLNFGKRFN